MVPAPQHGTRPFMLCFSSCEMLVQVFKGLFNVFKYKTEMLSKFLRLGSEFLKLCHLVRIRFFVSLLSSWSLNADPDRW